MFQFIAGLLTYPRSIQYEFTKSWETAEFIKAHNYKDYVLIGAPNYAVLPVATILDREIYTVETNRFSKAIQWWGINRKGILSLQEFYQKCIYIMKETNKRVLIILNQELLDSNGMPITTGRLTNNILLKKIKSFEGDVISQDEQYYLYEMIVLPYYGERNDQDIEEGMTWERMDVETSGHEQRIVSTGGGT